MTLRILQRAVGALQMNATLAVADGEAILFDPGDEWSRIRAMLDEAGVPVRRLVATHGHLDHVGVAAQAVAELGLPLECHPLCADWLANLEGQARMFGMPVPEPVEPGGFLDEGDTVAVGDTRFEVLHCPGHSPDSLCFFAPASDEVPPMLVGGDVLFRDSVGRTDFIGGDSAQLMASIRDKLMALPDETLVFPGHGPQTTIGREREKNPFVTGRMQLA
ncbi:MAG: MBL fold metallo-hydrolase [Candidatus Poseidoniia archaeon]|jgi:glyoxylase-like metal-dependent hydrolase (beta-lactamase superfamily II)|nr:MBL fold metallo-hydrolase [Candidatus Poseidoniia archaeon]MDP6658947.1 MBL fold metallo-hydrolase [Candidatus Poseidoniia archaeon]|tara:strand:+ start:4694 stop:5350 length:657 start_codon:yes stop_codon:yes gene_type:complete